MIHIVDAPSPNFDDRVPATRIRRVIIHGTAGKYPSDLGWLCNPQTNLPPEARNRVSCHFYINQAGACYRLVPMAKRAWHARGHNNDSIGIELECRGPGHPYSDQQYATLSQLLVEVVFTAYPQLLLSDLMGHVDVDPARKSDPWPQFDWARLKVEVQMLRRGPIVPEIATPTAPAPLRLEPVTPVSQPVGITAAAALAPLAMLSTAGLRAGVLGAVSLLAGVGWVSPDLQEFVGANSDELIAVLSGCWGLVAAKRAWNDRQQAKRAE